HQAGVRLCQGALSRAGEEHSSPDRDLRIGQSVHRAPASVARPTGVVRPQRPANRANTAMRPPIRPTIPDHRRMRKNFQAPHPRASPLFRPSLTDLTRDLQARSHTSSVQMRDRGHKKKSPTEAGLPWTSDSWDSSKFTPMAFARVKVWPAL